MSAFARAAIVGIVALLFVVSPAALEAQTSVSPAGASPPKHCESWPNPKDGAVYRFIPAGDFMMGCVPGDSKCGKDEKPRHPVRIERGFWMMATEVEVGQYRLFVDASEWSMPKSPTFSQEDNHPVVNVTWLDAKAYCEWAGGRLATEAEWEYAARGGHDGLIFPWGNEISHEDANFVGAKGKDKWKGTSPVGSFDPNDFGLSDVGGNVGEWIAEMPRPYQATESNDLDPGSVRGFRGGSWEYPGRILRTSCRMSANLYLQNDGKGIRCVRDVE